VIIETVLFASLFSSLFHHKKKVTAPTAEQVAFAALIAEDEKVVANAITGAQAFEKDVRMAQYERPEIDAFERQIYVCVQDTDPMQFDKDVDTLIEDGNVLMALDRALEKENVI
jgi:hypothetical protein